MKKLLWTIGFILSASPARAQPPIAVPAHSPVPAPPRPPIAVPAHSAIPADYRKTGNWLCLPGRNDACRRAILTADLNPNGYGPVTQSAPAAAPPIDCFYVYPTVSRDSWLNSDLLAGPEEQGTAWIQFGRFASVCRPFAPLYRQVTLAALPHAFAGEDISANFNLAYADVRAAWHYYLAHYNNGRRFVLIGHSQGTIHLIRLLAEDIENRPEAARMLSALLIGFAVEVPEGAVVGGSLQRTPLCTQNGQTGCVVTYMSFRASSPPLPDALMGRAAHPGMTAGCVNPAALAGGSAPLDSYWYAPPTQFDSPAITWSSTGPFPAPFLHAKGLISGECRHDGQAGWLAISVNADPTDARTDVIPGDVYLFGQLIPGWGLHIGDTSYALGDLIHLVETQRDAMPRRRR